MQPPSKLHPALLGGLFIGVVSALPYVKAANSCCCLWLAVGGLLAAWVMQQNHPRPIALADGAVAGLLAGLFGFVIMLAVSIPIGMLTGPEPALSPGMLETEGMSPEVRDLVRSVPPAAFAVIGGLLFLVIGAIVSTVGGILGAALFRRRVEAPLADAPMPAGWEAPAPPVPPPVPDSRDQGPPPIDSPS
jgi:hypothetical protein